MANTSRRSVAPARKLAAAVLGTIATFVILFGAGMASWAIVALGVALLVLALSLALVNVVRRGARAWVAGTAHVVSVSEPPASSTYGRCELQIVVDAPGLPAAAVKVRDPRVPIAKWPDPGSTLPVMVAVDDMRHVRIMWDEVMTHAEAASVMGDVPPEYRDPDADLPADDILVEQPPPWSTRDQQDWSRDPGGTEPVTADLTDQLGGLRDEPVVVRERPGGPIVLEGTLVEPDDPRPSQLPRRSRPSPRPRPSTDPTAPPGTGTGRSEPAGPPTSTALADPPTISGTDMPPDPAPAPAAAPAGDAVAADNAPDDVDDDLAAAAPGAAGGFHGVGITILVANLERSTAFYRDLLGFYEIDGGDGNVVLASGDTRLVLRAVHDVAGENRRSVHLNLEVGDVDRVHEELKNKGVRFTYGPRVVNRGEKLELWAAAFRDPDGHGIALTQWKPVAG